MIDVPKSPHVLSGRKQLCRVSVVVPFYNRADLLRLTLESIQSQSFDDFEVIMVDDGSGDGSKDVALEFESRDARFKYVYQDNGGCASARNNGFTHSDPRSEFVIFLDSDDIWHPLALERLLNHAGMYPNANVFFSPWHKIELIGHLGQSLPHLTKRRVTHVQLLRRVYGPSATDQDCEANPLKYMSTINLFWSPGAVLIRRCVIPPIPFDRSLKNCEDWHFWIRLAATCQFIPVDGLILYYRKHEGAKSNNPLRMAQQMKLLFDKLIDDPTLTPESRAVITDGHARQYGALVVYNRMMAIESLMTGQMRDAARFTVRSVKSWQMGRTINSRYIQSV